MAKRKAIRNQAKFGEGPLGKGPDDEELFVLRARDPLARTLVEAWADLSVQIGVPAAKIQEARACAERMREWQREHGTKIPD